MKRIITILILSLLPVVAISARQKQKTPVIQVLESYKEIKGVRHLDLGGLMLDFAKPSIRKTPASALIHNLEGVSILMIDDKFPDLQNRFQTDIAKVLNSSYTKIAEREQNGAKSHIYIDEAAKETFSELAMMITGDGATMAMVFTGEFNKKSLEEMHRLSQEEKKQ